TWDGAVIPLLVGVSGIRRKRLESVQLPVPPEIGVLAILDTGSHVTAFTPGLFEKLEIGPFDQTPLHTPSTKIGEPCLCDRYDVSVTLLSGMVRQEFLSIYAIAAECFDSREKVQAILGRDILDRCVFTYHG